MEYTYALRKIEYSYVRDMFYIEKHEDMQHTIPNFQNSKTQVTAILEHLIDEEELSLHPIFDSEETVNAATVESTYDEVEKYIEVVSERPEEPQKESKEDQPLVLVKPPTLPSIFVRPYKGVDVKERSRVCNTVDTFVLADHDLTDSFVLEVSDELPNLKEDAHAALPKYVDASFVVDISKGEGIM
ncbi:hypothetical protein Sjap_018084 [Stephania japonica]|uniref:Uncharacterized protein n=1 Tax=Stephania japonica TaxID=461633 RepID=A0AAP0I7C1_9MAGN